MKKILFLFASFSISAFSFAGSYITQGSTANQCYETKKESCDSYSHGTFTSRWTYTGNPPNDDVGICDRMYNGQYNNDIPMYACAYEPPPPPPPPSCYIKIGMKYVDPSGELPVGWEQSDEEGCYAFCQYIVTKTEGSEPIECTYTGNPSNFEPDGQFGNVPDPTDPDFCHVPGTESWECLDWDHPFNEPGTEEGCGGKQYGTVDFGNGPVGVCVPQGGGGEGFNGIDTSQDIDGDGKLNANDNDIDGDGIPNDSDDDRDGDGIKNTDDSNPDGNQGAGEGEAGTDANGDTPKGQATICSKRPTSTGDAQLAAIHQQLWLNECKGKGADVVNELKEANKTLNKMLGEASDTEAESIVNSALSTSIANFNDITDSHIDGIDTGSENGGPMAGIIEGSGLKSAFNSVIPSAQACSPMQLQFMSKLNMPIPCDKFQKFKEWFGWALGIFTLYSIILIAIAPINRE